MGRGRSRIEPIQMEKARNATFQKRKNGLIKKAYEFSTLCGVDAALIIYGPKSDDLPSEPVTWPRDRNEVLRIIEKYNAKIAERPPKNYDVDEFFKDRNNKVEAEISKVRKETLKILYPTWDERFDALEEEQLRMLVGGLDAKLDECNQRISMMKINYYPKGKAVESNDHMAVAPYLTSNGSHLNFMHNMSPLRDNNQAAFNLFQLDNSLQSQVLPRFDQNYMQLPKNSTSVNWTDQVSALNFYPTTHHSGEKRVENSPNSSLSYCNGSVQTLQPFRHYPTLQSTLPSSQNMQHEVALRTISPISCMASTDDYYTMLQGHVNK